MNQFYPYGYPPPMIMPDEAKKHQEIFEKATKIAERMMTREAREKERQENLKKKQRDEDRKLAERRRGSTLLAIEWFILGCVLYPFVGSLYQAALLNVQHWAHP